MSGNLLLLVLLCVFLYTQLQSTGSYLMEREFEETDTADSSSAELTRYPGARTRRSLLFEESFSERQVGNPCSVGSQEPTAFVTGASLLLLSSASRSSVF